MTLKAEQDIFPDIKNGKLEKPEEGEIRHAIIFEKH